MKRLSMPLAAALCALAVGGAFAQATPVGVWKTIDDETKTEKSLVRISESGGVLSGRVEKLLNVSKPDAVCDKCSGDRKDKPLLGLEIIRGVRKSEEALWDGGTVLDPNNGKVYKVRLLPAEGGKKLEVRGYIGAPLLGRTQTWLRVE